MKKIVLLSAIVITILVSCSTDDTQMDYNQMSRKKVLSKENKGDNSNFRIIYNDTLSREGDSIASEPVRPKKD